MPQYDFFFNGKGMDPRCLSKTRQLHIVSLVAGGGTEDGIVFVLNKERQQEFVYT